MRVLKPGGLCVFVEHVAAEGNKDVLPICDNESFYFMLTSPPPPSN